PTAGHDVQLATRVFAEGRDPGDREAVERGGELAGVVAEVRLGPVHHAEAPDRVAAEVREEVVALEAREDDAAIRVAADHGADGTRRRRRRQVLIIVDRRSQAGHGAGAGAAGRRRARTRTA